MSDNSGNSSDIEQEEDILFDRFLNISENNNNDDLINNDNDTTTIHRIHINNGNRPQHLVTRGNIEFRRTLGDIINTLEIELDRQNNNNNNDTANTEQRREEPRFIPRRSIFASIIRHLLVLDYFVMIVLFPFSFYNILRSGFSSVTLSENDFIAEIMIYLKYGKVISNPILDIVSGRTSNNNNNNVPITLLGYSDDAVVGLLGKFHNIIVYYSSPIGKKIINFASDYNSNSQSPGKFSFLVIGYEIWVKISVIMTYLVYGLTGTIYLALSGFFFIFCLALTIIRRYRSVQKLLVSNIVLTTSLQDREEGDGARTDTTTGTSDQYRQRSTSPNYTTFVD